ncbi:MAG: caspase family protein, partial [Gammaproteobacteria bacterium]|nr:caspase family protein [Gammaproteobacteria bacterium]
NEGLTVIHIRDRATSLSPTEEQQLIAANWNGPTNPDKRIQLAAARIEERATRPSPMLAPSAAVTGLNPAPLAGKTLSIQYRLPPQAGPDDIAVVIGTGDYTRLGRDIPDVTPAHADADAFIRYAREGLGVRPGNIISMRDATQAQLFRVFGSGDNPQGQLHDWIQPGRSHVYVYFAGHGAPMANGKGSYLVPADADSARLELNGYPLDTLYANLARLPAASVTVVLEACFSGQSQAGAVIKRASPLFVRPLPDAVPKGITVIAASGMDQIASWEPDGSHGLFTKYFLLAMSGEADLAPYGDGNGRVADQELETYLHDTLTYWARRYYSRDQVARIVHGDRS